jgi:large subunit ribosomal protein L30
MAGKLRVTLVKSPISHNPANRATVKALGLHRIGESIEIDDTPQLRGMVRAIQFLLKTEELDAADSAVATRPADRPARGNVQTKEKASS